MRLKAACTYSLAVALCLGWAAPATAGTNIAWTWNSSDKDSQARFASNGDDYFAKEFAGTNFVDWSGSAGDGRWYIPGAADGAERKLDLDFAEGTTATLQVCQQKTGWPNDCSSVRSGVA